MGREVPVPEPDGNEVNDLPTLPAHEARILLLVLDLMALLIDDDEEDDGEVEH